jgi:hypothetical protein
MTPLQRLYQKKNELPWIEGRILKIAVKRKIMHDYSRDGSSTSSFIIIDLLN